MNGAAPQRQQINEIVLVLWRHWCEWAEAPMEKSVSVARATRPIDSSKVKRQRLATSTKSLLTQTYEKFSAKRDGESLILFAVWRRSKHRHCNGQLTKTERVSDVVVSTQWKSVVGCCQEQRDSVQSLTKWLVGSSSRNRIEGSDVWLVEMFVSSRSSTSVWLVWRALVFTLVTLPHGIAERSSIFDRFVCALIFSWWRAPEVFINWERYDEKVDIWSVGCIMAELILLRPLFAGTDHIDQLGKIFDVVGTPDSQTLQEICEPCQQILLDWALLSTLICFSDAREYIEKLPTRVKQDFQQLFGNKYQNGVHVSGVSQQGVELLEQLLSFDHRIRPSATQALGKTFRLFDNDQSDLYFVQLIRSSSIYTIPWKNLPLRHLKIHIKTEFIRSRDGNVSDLALSTLFDNIGKREKNFSLRTRVKLFSLIGRAILLPIQILPLTDWKKKRPFGLFVCSRKTTVFLCVFVSAIIWKMVEEFQPPPWINEDLDEEY